MNFGIATSRLLPFHFTSGPTSRADSVKIVFFKYLAPSTAECPNAEQQSKATSLIWIVWLLISRTWRWGCFLKLFFFLISWFRAVQSSSKDLLVVEWEMPASSGQQREHRKIRSKVDYGQLPAILENREPSRKKCSEKEIKTTYHPFYEGRFHFGATFCLSREKNWSSQGQKLKFSTIN